MGTTQPIRNYEELQEFKHYYLQEKNNKRNYLLIVMGLNSALRISDILALTCGDVFDFKELSVKKHLAVKEKKTGKSRVIFLNEEIRNALNFCVDFSTQDEKSWLFEGKGAKGKHLCRQQAYRIIRKAAEESGLCEHISCHSMRKTFGYVAWKQGVQPALLMNIFNHSSFAITKRYLGIDQDDRDEVYKNVRI